MLIGCAAASALLLVAVALLPATVLAPLVVVVSGIIGTVSSRDTGPLLGIWGVGSLLGGIIATRTHASGYGAGAVTVLIAALAAGHAR